jgi:hypothetical protein
MAITYPPIFKATFRIREAYGNTRAYPVSREGCAVVSTDRNKTLGHRRSLLSESWALSVSTPRATLSTLLTFTENHYGRP